MSRSSASNTVAQPARAAEGHRATVVPALQKALASADPRTRCHAVRALEKIGPGSIVPALDGATGTRGDIDADLTFYLLRDPDPEVRVETVHALARLRRVAAVPALADRLRRDPDGDVRIEVAGALGAIGAPGAVEVLIHCVRHDGYPELDAPGDDLEFPASWEVQRRCLEALGALGNADAADAVIELLANEDYEHLHEAGYRVLARLDGARARSFLAEQLRNGGPWARRYAVRTLVEMPLPDDRDQPWRSEMTGALLAALDDPDAGIRLGAARALHRLGHSTAVVPVMHLLHHSNLEVRAAAVTALGEIGDHRAVQTLHALLAEPGAKLRRTIVDTLGAMADPSSVPPLVALLEVTDRDLRYAVVHALDRIGITGPEQALSTLLNDASNDADLRTAAAGALEKIAPQSRADREIAALVVQALEAAVHDPNQGVAFAALGALAHYVPEQAAARLIELVRGTYRPEPVPAAAAHEDTKPTAAMTPKEAAEAFGYARGTDPACATLAAIAAEVPPAASLAAEATGAPSPIPSHLPRLAARLIGGLERPGPEVVRALQDAFPEADTELRREILLALGRVGASRAVPTILQGLEDPEADIRLTALHALRALYGRKEPPGDRDGVAWAPIVARRLEDLDAGVRECAVRTLCVHGPEAFPKERWQRLLDDEAPAVRRAALAALPAHADRREMTDLVLETVFRDSGELLHEAVDALLRIDRGAAVARLLPMLEDARHEEQHWICIDLLAALHSGPPARGQAARRA